MSSLDAFAALEELLADRTCAFFGVPQLARVLPALDRDDLRRLVEKYAIHGSDRRLVRRESLPKLFADARALLAAR